MAKAKTVYSSKDDIPEGLEDFYVERDGTFRFDANDYETDEEIQNLRKALREERDRADDAEKKLKDLPDDFDAEKWDALKHVDPEDLNSDGDEALKRENDRLKTKISNLESEVEEKESIIQKKEQQDARRTQYESISSALKEVGSTDQFYNETWTEKILANEDVEIIDDEVYVNNMPVDKYASKQKDTELGKRFTVAPENVGSGSRNNGKSPNGDMKNNPFAEDTLNRTKQMEVINKDKKKARRMAEKAGWSEQKINRVIKE